jgi:hypothetical protein
VIFGYFEREIELSWEHLERKHQVILEVELEVVL